MYETIYQSFIAFSVGMAILTAIPTIALVLIIWFYLRFIRDYIDHERKHNKPPPKQERKQEPKNHK